MFHRGLSKRHQHLMLATAIIAAWMWSLPLFGGLQTLLPHPEELGISFSFLFLIGSICGYLPLATGRPLENRSQLAAAAPLISLALMIILMVSGAWLTRPAPHLYLTLALAMGASTAPLFSAWGASISWVPEGQKGRYVGEMLLAASATHVIVLSLLRLHPPGALVFLSLLVGVSAYLLRIAGLTEADFALPEAENVEAAPQPEEQRRGTAMYWLLFFFLLISYYSLSWTGHDVILSVAGEGPLIALAGPVLYGVAALLAGMLVDRTAELEAGAMIGLALMISSYIVAPVVTTIPTWTPLSLALEASYGVLDLFVFVCIAAAARMLGRSPYHYYALGLALNAGVVASGYAWLDQAGSADFGASHSLVMSAALIMGTFSVIALRGLRRQLQGQAKAGEEGETDPIDDGFSTEELTPRQKEVVALMMEGHDNATIAQKLHITANTLKTHIRNIYAKAQVNSRAHLILKINRWSEEQAREEVERRMRQQ